MSNYNLECPACGYRQRCPMKCDLDRYFGGVEGKSLEDDDVKEVCLACRTNPNKIRGFCYYAYKDPDNPTWWNLATKPCPKCGKSMDMVRSTRRWQMNTSTRFTITCLKCNSTHEFSCGGFLEHIDMVDEMYDDYLREEVRICKDCNKISSVIISYSQDKEDCLNACKHCNSKNTVAWDVYTRQCPECNSEGMKVKREIIRYLCCTFGSEDREVIDSYDDD